MEIEQVILGVQIVSIVGFLTAIFVPYRALVDSKGAVIESKDATIQMLRLQVEEKNEKTKELQQQAPDVLAKSLNERVKATLEEIGRLRQDKDLNSAAIESKEIELHDVRTKLEQLSDLISDWGLTCPTCHAPILTRVVHTVYGSSGGRDVEADVEYVEYRCGYSTGGTGPDTPCQAKTWASAIPN